MDPWRLGFRYPCQGSQSQTSSRFHHLSSAALEAFVSFWRATNYIRQDCNAIPQRCAFQPPLLTTSYLRTNPFPTDFNYLRRSPFSVMAPKKASTGTSSASASSGAPATWATSTFDTMWSHYQKTTTHQTKLIDVFMLFLVVVGAIQFVYYVLLARDVRGKSTQTETPFRTINRGLTRTNNSLSMRFLLASLPMSANSFLLVRNPLPRIHHFLGC